MKKEKKKNLSSFYKVKLSHHYYNYFYHLKHFANICLFGIDVRSLEQHLAQLFFDMSYKGYSNLIRLVLV